MEDRHGGSLTSVNRTAPFHSKVVAIYMMTATAPIVAVYFMPYRARSRMSLMTDTNSEIVQWTFFGRILPERVTISIQFPMMEVEIPLHGARLSVDLNIHQCQVIAMVKVTSGSIEVFDLRNVIEEHCRSVTDVIGFKSGMSFDVDIISCMDVAGNWRIFASEIPILFEKKKHAGLQITIEELGAILTNPHARIALADFREAMRVPLQTGFFCYRCIETMMQSMKSAQVDKDSLVWEKLRSSLRIEQEAIRFVKGHADWARHGRTGNITDAERAEIFSLTDEIISRYITFLQGGSLPLSQGFDMLGRTS